MGLVLLLLGLAFGTQIWLCFRVGRSSVALAVATFFIGFPAALHVTDAALFSVEELSATLFKCDSANACRNLAL
jgi:hypothetical protein